MNGMDGRSDLRADGGYGVDLERGWALPAAVALLALENAALLGALMFLGSVPPLIPLFLLVKFPFCVGLLQRGHGAFVFLTFWEASLVVVALLNPALDPLPRLMLLSAAAGGLALLGMSLAVFPEGHLLAPTGRRPLDGSAN